MLRDLVKHKTDLVVRPTPDYSEIELYQIEDKLTGEKGGYISEGVFLDETSWIEPNAIVVCLGAHKNGKSKLMLSEGTIVKRDAKVYIYSGILEKAEIGYESVVRCLFENLHLINGDMKKESLIEVSIEGSEFSFIDLFGSRIEGFRVEDHGQISVESSINATHLNVGKGSRFIVKRWYGNDSVSLVDGVIIGDRCSFKATRIKNLIIRELALVGEDVAMEFKSSKRKSDNVRLIIKNVVVHEDSKNIDVVIADGCDAIWTNYNNLEYDWSGEYLITKSKIMNGD